MLQSTGKHLLGLVAIILLHYHAVSAWVNPLRSLRTTLSLSSSSTPEESLDPSKKGVYGKAKAEDLIRQTDYLKNPRPKKAVEPVKSEETKKAVETYSNGERLVLLEQSLVSFNSSSANDIIAELGGLRQQEGGQELIAAILGNLLEEGPDSLSLPFWTKIRPLARFSRRCRLASLRRTLELTTPPPNAEDSDKPETDEDKQRRRRRALVTILRSLESDENSEEGSGGVPAIRLLEKKSRMEVRGVFKNEKMTARRPDGLETPKYEVLDKKSDTYEVRLYSSYSVCSVNMDKPRPADASKTDATVSDPKSGGAKAFGALAGYLFGKNEQKQAMKMTTPVLFTDDDSQGKMMSFVLPSEYWENETVLKSAPAPLKESGVMLSSVEGGTRATIMFGGYAGKKATEQQEKKLLRLLEKDEKWKVIDGESCVVAQYNDPFTPPWKRLNEVSIAVESR